MEKEKLKEQLLKLADENPFGYFRVLKRENYRDMLQFVYDSTAKLVDSGSFRYALSTRLFWIRHGIEDFPACPVCGRRYGEFKDVSDVRPYPKTCSSKRCRYAHAQTLTVRTNLEKYGVKSTLSLESVRLKSRQTVLAKYGVEHQSRSSAVRAKIARTCMERYGVDNYSKTADCTRKRKRTKLKRYGDENYVNSEKAVQTKRLRYGAGCFGIMQKAARTCFEKYGVCNYAETEQFKRRIRWKKSENALEKLRKSDVKLLDDVGKFVVRDRAEYRWRCRKCGHEFVARYDSNFETRFGIPVRCPVCHPVSPGYSNEEKAFVDFVKGVYCGRPAENTKSVISPYELDLYLPDENLAFEFDGLFWHSEQAGKPKDYHLRKTEICEKLGVRLVHVFENEWTSKKDIVKSYVKRMLRQCDRTMHADECDVRETTSDEYFTFQNENHIKGSAWTSVGIGLYFKDELVSLAAFDQVQPEKWELTRFCDKLDVDVVGSFRRLLEYFENAFRPRSLVCRCDRRWPGGELRRNAGFDLAETSGPACWHFDRTCRLRLVDRPGAEDAKLDGKMRIFDCGSYVFEKKYPDSR